MMTSYFEVCDRPGDNERRDCTLLGHACALMAASPSHAQLPHAYLADIVIPAITHGQLKVWFNEDGVAVGYVIWARLAPDVERRAMQTGQFSLHESEWNEGDTLWILDFLAPLGHLRYMLADLRDHVFAHEEAVRYLRLKNNRRMAKEVQRDPRLSFFAGRRSLSHRQAA